MARSAEVSCSIAARAAFWGEEAAQTAAGCWDGWQLDLIQHTVLADCAQSIPLSFTAAPAVTALLPPHVHAMQWAQHSDRGCSRCRSSCSTSPGAILHQQCARAVDNVPRWVTPVLVSTSSASSMNRQRAVVPCSVAYDQLVSAVKHHRVVEAHRSTHSCGHVLQLTVPGCCPLGYHSAQVLLSHLHSCVCAHMAATVGMCGACHCQGGSSRRPLPSPPSHRWAKTVLACRTPAWHRLAATGCIRCCL